MSHCIYHFLEEYLWENECGIINPDVSTGPGTHWVACKENGKIINFFDSFGNLQSPPEVLNYYYRYEKKEVPFSNRWRNSYCMYHV